LSYLKFHADQLFDGYRFRDQDEVLITDDKGIIIDIVSLTEAGEDIRKIEGIICPGFVNVHCHLELSYLKDTIPTNTGLVSFLSQVMQSRNAVTEIIEEAIVKAENEMLANGIVAVGDICNTTHTIRQKQKGRISYHNFIEVAGFAPANAQQRYDAVDTIAREFNQYFPDTTSIIPHAPYSVSKPLFKLIKNNKSNKLFSIHNQECDAENDFFKNKQGDFLSLYKNIGLDLSFFSPTGKRSVEYYLSFIPKEINALFVHNTTSTEEDLHHIISNLAHPFFCICPSANLYIEGRLPDIELFRKMSSVNNMVVGTDSLASNSSLNILKELMVIKDHYPTIELEELLKWGTINGAKALGMEKEIGSFEKSKNPGVINLVFEKNFVKNLVF